MALTKTQVEQHRRRRLWLKPDRRVRSRANAKSFVESAGLALLLPSPDTELPSLWQAHTDDVFDLGWSDQVKTVWAWRDELAKRREAASGPYFRTKSSLIAPRLLSSFMVLQKAPRTESELWKSEKDPEALAILKVLARKGPTAAIALRRVAGLDDRSARRRFNRIVETLERGFRIAKVGIEQEADSHWPSQVFDLFVRAFPDAAPESMELSRDQALQRIVRAHFEAVACAAAKPVATALSVRTREVTKTFLALQKQNFIEPASDSLPADSYVLVAKPRLKLATPRS